MDVYIRRLTRSLVWEKSMAIDTVQIIIFIVKWPPQKHFDLARETIDIGYVRLCAALSSN